MLLHWSSFCTMALVLPRCLSWSFPPPRGVCGLSSSFLGGVVQCNSDRSQTDPLSGKYPLKSFLYMRKQKASDKRTRRRQQQQQHSLVDSGGDQGNLRMSVNTITASPMHGNDWNRKATVIGSDTLSSLSNEQTSPNRGGRQRSRKRSAVYNSLAAYHNTFLDLLTYEYKAEEEEVIGRIKASIDDPIGLETAGHALFDMQAERRGNLFSDEVYRLVKAPDATTVYPRSVLDDSHDHSSGSSRIRYLPHNHKFTNNDVILLTVQPAGAGDLFSPNSLPVSESAVTLEARVLAIGPTYIDIAVKPGLLVATLGEELNKIRLRADRFFSNIPYQRMVEALGALTALPDKKLSVDKTYGDDKTSPVQIHTDELLREAILQTFQSVDTDYAQSLASRLSKPPMATSHQLASQVLKFVKSNSNGVFRPFNAPQLAAINAALTRRLTMIHGPPGSGKTTVAATIAFGFVHQCRSLPSGAKVLATAFSNVGADNLAEAMKMKLGLKVVRIGKASAVTETLWDVTLDAAIDRDPDAQKALKRAAEATAELARFRRNKLRNSVASSLSERSLQEVATFAVKASIKACNIAATRALREADVIVTTSTGAADPRLLAACGVGTELNDEDGDDAVGLGFSKTQMLPRNIAPDGLSPLSLPFVIIDEACQSIEPASLIPVVSTNSCRALVMLGDPCQLPPTVRSQEAADLQVSLMERLAAMLPSPTVSPSGEGVVDHDTHYLNQLAIKQAKSLLQYREQRSNAKGNSDSLSYRKKFAGSFLLSVQYRMHPSIAAFPSAIFYNGLLATPRNIASQKDFPRFLAAAMPCADPQMSVRFINVGGRSNERQGIPSKFTRTVFTSTSNLSLSEAQQTTYWNEPEAERVISLITDIVRDPSRQVTSLGIVTPYNGQVQLIKSMIAADSALRKLLLSNPISIEVKSVDGYQGRERDIIVFSAVRSNRQGQIGFLHDWRRLNVALTRAKSGLLIVGDLETLAEADMHWDSLARWVTAVRCVYDDYENPDDEPSF